MAKHRPTSSRSRMGQSQPSNGQSQNQQDQNQDQQQQNQQGSEQTEPQEKRSTEDTQASLNQGERRKVDDYVDPDSVKDVRDSTQDKEGVGTTTSNADDDLSKADRSDHPEADELERDQVRAEPADNDKARDVEYQAAPAGQHDTDEPIIPTALEHAQPDSPLHSDENQPSGDRPDPINTEDRRDQEGSPEKKPQLATGSKGVASGFTAEKPEISSDDLPEVVTVKERLTEYVEGMRPGKAHPKGEGAAHQQMLYRTIQFILRQRGKTFTQCMDALMAVIHANEKGCFDTAYAFRYIDQLSLSAQHKATFTNLLSLFTRAADPKKRQLALKQIDLSKGLKTVTDSESQQLLVEYFSRQ